MKNNKLGLIAIITMLFIAACGNKGALYLPDADSSEAKAEAAQNAQ